MSRYSNAVLQDSPVSYWRLDETSGTNAVDQQAANTGTYTNTFTLAQPGLVSSDSDAAVLLGAPGYVDVGGYSPFAANSQRTFECWAQKGSSPANSALFGGASSAGTMPTLFFDSATNMGFYPANVTEASWAGAWPGSNVAVHVVLTIDDSARIAELFINGVSQGAKATGASYSTPGTLRIGAYGSSGSPGGYFAGTVDEFAVYNGLLSADRILAHYNAAFGVGAFNDRYLPRRLGPAKSRPTFFAPLEPQPPAPLVPGPEQNRGPQAAQDRYLPRKLGPKAVGPTYFAPLEPVFTTPLVYGPEQYREPKAAQDRYLPRRLGPGAVPTYFAALPPSGAVQATVRVDAVTGNLIFGGSVSESRTGADSPSGALIFGGSIVQSWAGATSPSGTLIFGGTVVDGKAGTDARTGNLIFGGSATDALAASDTRFGALIFGGVMSESLTGSDTRLGNLLLGGSTSEAAVFSASPSGSLILGGQLGYGTPIGTLIFGGTLTERHLRVLGVSLGKVNTRTADEQVGAYRIVYIDLTGDSSYPTNGWSLKASDLGFSELYEVRASSDGTYLPVYDYVNSKLKVFSALGTEVTNATDLHTITFRIAAAGSGFATLGLK